MPSHPVCEPKWTKGPWRLDGAVVRGRTTGHERPICEIYRELTSSDETIANASLIVMAPDLASEIKQCASDLREAARLILAKGAPNTARLFMAAADRADGLLSRASGEAT